MAAQAPAPEEGQLPIIDLKSLLSRMWPLANAEEVTADDIAEGISYFFTNQVSEVQAGALLMCLHFTGLDRNARVMAKTAAAMLKAAAPMEIEALRQLIANKGRKEGDYQGGLCDIVGTGGDSHNTFNISTTSSILASSLLLLAKHGNKASTSKSGSADLLNSMLPRPPQISRVRPDTIAEVYAVTNYAFLYAPVFHPGMRYVAPIRRQLPWRTLFNLLGPLANPTDVGLTPTDKPLMEARVLGVARTDLGPIFADALRMAGATKAMVVCGEEELDEVSIAGPTKCWRLRESDTSPGETIIEHFRITPADFGVPSHPLSDVSPGKEPTENAKILAKILGNELPEGDPIVDFVLINTAALFVISGICEADTSDMGYGDDGVVITERGPGGGRWKEGVRRAKWAIKSGEAARQWKAFVDVTNGFSE